MALSDNLISQFAKSVVNKKETKQESTVWGEVVSYSNGKCYVKLDGSDRVTPVIVTTEAKEGDRVAITIKNHSATLMGNTSSPAASIGTTNALRTDFKNLSADNVDIRGKLTAAEGHISSLTADNAEIKGKLIANEAAIEDLQATTLKAEVADIKYATIESLNAVNGEFRNLLADYATITNLKAERAEIDEILAGKATIVDLAAVQASVGSLDADVADINTLIFGSASGSSIHTSFANAVIAQLGDAQIKSAMIQDISAGKITSGEIITDKVKIKSEDGSLIISGPVLQIGDGAQTRIQIGKDASGTYSFAIFNATGEPIFYEDGITENGIPDNIIANDMIKEDANISASKLDIDTLFSVINNDGSHTLKSNKIKLDEKNQTLDVAFGALTTKVDGIQIGGINLLKKTRSFDGVGGASSIIEDTYHDLKVRYLDCTDMASGYPLFRDMAQWAEAITAEGGAQYTFSFYAKGTKIRAHFFNGAFGVVRAESSQGIVKTSAVNDGNMDFTLTDEWKRYWVTYTVEDTNTQDSTGKKYVLLLVLGLEEAYVCGVKFEKGNKATDWSPAPEDAETEISSLNSQYHNLNVTIGDLRSTIGDQSQEIAKKADGTTVATLSDQYSDLNQTVNGLSSTVGSHTTQFNQLSDDFNNLSIGGRNLLINTGNTTGTIKMRNSSSTQMNGVSGFTNNNGVRTWNCHVNAVPVGTSNPPEIYYRFMPTTSDGLRDLEAGETYIFSGKVKLSTTSGTLTRLAVRTQGFVSPSWTGGINNNILTEDSDEWVEFSEKFTVQNNATNYYVSLQLYYEVGTEYSGVIQIKEFKIEKGNKKTEWSPAPEDAETRMIAAETAITQNKNDITLRATKTEVDTGVNAAKSYADAQIEVASKGITQTVSSTYTTKDEFNNLSIGGTNLIQNTKDPSDSSHWTRGNVVKDDELNENVFYMANSSTAETTSGTHRIKVVSGEWYTVSALVKRTANVKNIDFFFLSRKESDTSDFAYIQNKTNMTPEAGKWVRLTWSFVMHSEAEEGYLRIDHNGSSDGTESRLYYTNIKVEKGQKATDWSPAPEDTKTEFATVRSEIKQLADSITLSVTGALGSTASIKLSANGATTTQTIDMSKVRSAFANDTTAITISAGKVTFNSGTIVINAGNFTLDASGNITASNATLEGTVTTISSTAMAKLTSGSLALYRNGEIYGAISSKYHNNAANNGLAITVRNSGSSGLMFVAAAGDDMFGTSYEIFYEMQPAYDDLKYCYDLQNEAQHTFHNNVRFTGLTQHISPAFFNQSIYLANQSTIGWLDKDDGGPWQLIVFSNSNYLTVGHKDYSATYTGNITTIHGEDRLHLSCSGDTIRFIKSTNSAYSAYFYPLTNGKTTLGIANNRWYGVYTVHLNATGTATIADLKVTTHNITTSDRRVKKDIDALSDIHSELFDKLQPVQYKLIDRSDRIQYGLIAQDVESAMVELGIGENDLSLVQHTYGIDDVTGDLTDEYGIAYNNLIPMLIHEVQKLKQKIKMLEGE